ncbi:MAG: hypothetical protein GX493_09770, partial [Firmicutes bacterium]|nr:hypothetical protein [Bacillota bacterium]
MLAHREILSLLAAWGIPPETVGAIRPVGDVFRVETSRGPLNLKWSSRSARQLLLIVRGLEYVYQKGFHACAPPLPTADGRPFLPHGNRHYLLFPWIEGKKASFAARPELLAACRTLARFHVAAGGFSAAEPGKDLHIWQKLFSSFARRQRQLEESLRLFADHELFAPSKNWQPVAAYYLALASFARRLLDRLKTEGGLFA